MSQDPKEHPGDIDLLEHFSVEPRPAVEAHLSGCQPCRNRMQELRSIFRVEPVAVERALDALPEEFWIDQRSAVLDRIREMAPAGGSAVRAGWFEWAWRPVAAAVCLLALSLSLVLTEQPAQLPVAQLSDDELLEDVQRIIQGKEELGGLESIYLLFSEELDKMPPDKDVGKGERNAKDLG